MIENAQNHQFLSCKWPQYHFSMVFIMVFIDSCSLLVCQMNIYCLSTHIDVNWRQFDVKNDRKCAKLQFLSCKWPQYHFSMVFMMGFIDFCSLLVFKMNIYWNSTHNDVNWRQFDVKNDRKCAKLQFLSSKWPQYHFSMVFMMVFINSCSLLVCQMNIYWNSTHIDANWRQFDVENDRKCQNRQFLSCSWPQYHF